MNKKRIRWEKFRNPLLPLDYNEEEENSRVMVRSTPFGIEGLQYNPDFPSERVYIAHTNFDIDENVKIIMDNMDGVEICEIYSPYRMRVTIGKAFNAKEVRRLITEKLCRENKSYIFNNDTNILLYKETLKMRSQDKPWSIFILPNGNFESKVFSSKEELETTLPEWEVVRKRIGGIILTE